MTTPKHSPLPWFNRGGRITAGERWVATTRPFAIRSAAAAQQAHADNREEDWANGALIELAVNNHARLLDAAKAAYGYLCEMGAVGHADHPLAAIGSSTDCLLCEAMMILRATAEGRTA